MLRPTRYTQQLAGGRDLARRSVRFAVLDELQKVPDGKVHLHVIETGGAYMMTTIPARQTRAPITSKRSGL